MQYRFTNRLVSPGGLLAVLLCALFCIQSRPAPAQTLPTPGAVQDTLPSRKPPAPPPPAQFVFPVTPAPVEHDPKGRRFTVNAFTFTGNTVYTARTLQRLVEPFIDLQLNLYDLTRAADAITQFYHDQDYIIARAVIPAQKVENGIVRIEIIEGRVGQLRFEGNRRYTPEFLRRRLTTLTPDGLIKGTGLEHDLLLLNELPGMTARATLEPGKLFGTTDIVIRCEEKAAFGFLGPDNYGRDEIGKWRLNAGVSLNNVLGFGDQLSFDGIEAQSNLLHYGHVVYSLPVNSLGTRMNFGYSALNYNIAGSLAPLAIAGDVHTGEIDLTHPFVRSRSQNLLFNLGLRSTHLRQSALGVPIFDNSIWLLNPGVSYNQIGTDASLTTVSAQVSSNFKSNTSGFRQDAEMFKLELDGTHLRGISRSWDVYVHGHLAQSYQPLADSEKFSLGGPDSVRGYRPSELRGDKGWLATVELRRTFTFANTVTVFSIFYDAGVVKFQAPTLLDGSITLMSAGAGVTFYPVPKLPIKLEFAVPVNNTIPSDGHTNGRGWLSALWSF